MPPMVTGLALTHTSSALSFTRFSTEVRVSQAVGKLTIAQMVLVFASRPNQSS